jgi:hypothetical protein
MSRDPDLCDRCERRWIVRTVTERLCDRHTTWWDAEAAWDAAGETKHD